MTRFFPFAMTLLLAACGPDTPPTPEAPSHQVANRNGISEQKATPSRLLQTMSEAEWRANIKDGVGCSLVTGDRLLLLVILGEGSIAKTGGTVRKLSGGDTGFDWEGGSYETDGLTITVRASTLREAQVTVVSGGQREQFQARWGCGS
jgi:hypothetical protein